MKSQRLFPVLFLMVFPNASLLFGVEIQVDQRSTAVTPDGSAAAPYKIISAALKVAKPGDAVVIKAGIYREHLAVPAGADGKSLTITAAPGERVIVSGCERLTGWKKHSDAVWMTTLDWHPHKLMLHFKEQTIARQPGESWWVSEVRGLRRHFVVRLARTCHVD